MIQGITNDFFVGSPGSGKTLLSIYDYVLPALIRGELVYSSTWINWSGDNLKLFSPDDFRSLIPKFQNCLLFLDEVQRVLEPREWDSENGDIRALFQLHRHRHINIVGTTQDPSLIAKSALIVIDNFIYTEKVNHNFLTRLIYGSSSIPLRYHYLNRQQLRSVFNFFDMGQDIPVLDSPQRSFKKIKSLLRYDLDEMKSEYYHYYCPLCASRHDMIDGHYEKVVYPDVGPVDVWVGKPISKSLDPYTLDIPKCPKHPTESLQIRESLMYDTDYEVKSEAQSDIIWKAFKRVKVDKLVESRSSIGFNNK